MKTSMIRSSVALSILAAIAPVGCAVDDAPPEVETEVLGEAEGAFSSLRGSQLVFVARHSDKCMDVSGGSTSDHAPLIQYDCHLSPNQQFYIAGAGHDTDNTPLVTIRNDKSAKCLDVPGGN